MLLSRSFYSLSGNFIRGFRVSIIMLEPLLYQIHLTSDGSFVFVCGRFCDNICLHRRLALTNAPSASIFLVPSYTSIDFGDAFYLSLVPSPPVSAPVMLSIEGVTVSGISTKGSCQGPGGKSNRTTVINSQQHVIIY